MTTKVKERPILFSGPMVRAILDGRKTQTRRVIKPKHEFFVDDGHDGAKRVYYPCYVTGEPEPEEIPCPYGSVGERLWVRETCWCDGCTVYYTADSARRSYSIEDRDTENRLLKLHHYANGVGNNVPSIHMPRWASRITLEITEVRVERLNAICLADCISEGIEPVHVHFVGETETTAYRDYSGLGVSATNAPFRSYQTLWESINGPGSWALNPWVWVVEFSRHS